MVQIKKEEIVKTFGEDDILIEIIKRFHYSTEEEKLEHKKLMEADGFKDSGQEKEIIGTTLHPELVWFGCYFKHERYRKISVDEQKNENPKGEWVKL